MLRDLFRNNRLDIALIILLSVTALLLSIFHHGEMKPIARAYAYIGPVIFATSLMALIAAMNLQKRFAFAKKSRRVLIDIAVGALAIAVFLSRSELFYAPFAIAEAAPPSVVIEQIASNDDVSRYKAWGRIMTLDPEGKDEVAVGLAKIITGTDEAALQSATLTLEYVLRPHSITTLIALGPDVKAYIEAMSAGLPPPVEGERAAHFTSTFIETGYKSVLKALEPKNRIKLPPGGIDALFLALATNGPIGQLFLKGFAEQGDDELKAKAIETLQFATFTPTT